MSFHVLRRSLTQRSFFALPCRCYAAQSTSRTRRAKLPTIESSTETPGIGPELQRPKIQVSRSEGASDDPSSRLELPPITEWRKYFPNDSGLSRDRVSIRKPETAKKIANAFVPAGSKGKVIIEAYPGPGALTRALLALPRSRIAKLIVLEEYDRYYDYIKPLEMIDDRIQVLPIPGFAWDTYQTVNDLGLLNGVITHPWNSGVHPQLHFISHLPSNIYGEQLIAQLFRSIPDQQWLFKYGRVPMSFLLSDYVWSRVSTSVRSPTRCKLTVIAEATSECKLALPSEELAPYPEHFHPVYLYRHAPDVKLYRRRIGNPFQAITITPSQEQAIKRGLLDKWDYCLRRMFVLKSQNVKSAIPALAPGAQVLLRKITSTDVPEEERVDIRKAVRTLSVQDWAIILKAFDEWPFAPEDLAIGDMFLEKRDTI